MYDVIAAVKSRCLLQELNRLRIWGNSTGFQIRKTTEDFEHLIEELRKTKYHLVLLEALPDNQVLSLLKTIKKENLCQAAAIVSETAEFSVVRKSFLLKHTKMKIIDIAGVLDYKDMGYFLKRFKAKYGVTPSQYRIPETFEFQI